MMNQTALNLLWDLLSQRAVGNLFLLLAAIIGVGGSYGLYWKRQKDRRDRLRHALKAELEAMDFFNQWPNEFEDTVPSHSILSTKTYEANADGLGLLSKKEIDAIVDFYTSARIIQDQIDWNFTISFQTEQIEEATDIREESRKAKVSGSLDSLTLKYYRALIRLNEKLGMNDLEEDWLNIEEGEVVSDVRPQLRRHLDVYLANGILEPYDRENGLYRITDKGRKFVEGNLDQSELEPVGDSPRGT